METRSRVHRSVLTLLVLLGLAPGVGAQSTPAPAPRVYPGDVHYLGSFPLPDADGRGGLLVYGGDAMGLGADGRSLYYSCIYGTSIARVAIPAIGDEAPLVAPCERVPNLAAIHPQDPNISVGGIAHWKGRLVVSAYSTYDAGHVARTSHFAGADVASLSGPAPVGTWNPGLVAGYMGAVPPSWQSRFGGPMLTGQCCLSIISRSSYGPSVSAFDPAALSGTRAVPATLLLGYPEGHTTIGPYESAGPFWGGTARVGGVAFPEGTRSVLFVGRVGTTFCYGNGTTDRRLHQMPDGQGGTWCFDPTSPYKGTHGYPYHHQMWAYDAEDLAAVARGEREPWDVTPYAAWTLPEMSDTPGFAEMRGATYDPQTRRLYVTPSNAAVVHVYEVARDLTGVPTEACSDGLDNDDNGLIDDGCPAGDLPAAPGAGGGSPPPDDEGGDERGGGSGDNRGDAVGTPVLTAAGGSSGGRMDLAAAGASDAAISACGTDLHVVYGGAATWYRKSVDAGATWLTPVMLGDGRPVGPAAIACDRDLVAAAVLRGGALWVWVSADGGASWASPTRLTGAAVSDAAVAVHAGVVRVAWTEAADASRWRLGVRASTDAGRSWDGDRWLATENGDAVHVALSPSGTLVASEVAHGGQRVTTTRRFADGVVVSHAAEALQALSDQGPIAVHVRNSTSRPTVERPAATIAVTLPVDGVLEHVAVARWGSTIAWVAAGHHEVAFTPDGGASRWRATLGEALPARPSLASDDAHAWLHVVGIGPAGELRYERQRYRPW